MIAIDTNLLIYAHRAGVPQHEASRTSIERAMLDRQGWGIAQPSIAEFWAIVTHPAATGRPSTQKEAAAFVRSLVEDGGAQIWYAGDAFCKRWAALAVELQIRGSRIFDLQIALIASENGAREIWTHDRRFVSVPGLRVRDPLRQ